MEELGQLDPGRNF